MKTFTSTIIVLFYASIALAENDEIYGVYESTFYQEMLAQNRNLESKFKEAANKAHTTITINKQKVIMTIGKTEPESISMNYSFVGYNAIIAVDNEMMQEMYFPIYIKDEILYTAGQRFKKVKSNK